MSGVKPVAPQPGVHAYVGTVVIEKKKEEEEEEEEKEEKLLNRHDEIYLLLSHFSLFLSLSIFLYLSMFLSPRARGGRRCFFPFLHESFEKIVAIVARR